jgi:Protein of unknown function (DUF4058)
MRSPFPGMDPYLEDPARWPGVHSNLINEIQAVLNRQLRPKYFARVEERVYISDEEDPGREVLIPDVRIAAKKGRKSSSTKMKRGQSLQVAEPVIRTKLLDDEIHEVLIRIVHRATGKVVTFLEVLSPSNKVAGSRGRASYEEKRQEVMTSLSHFVEINLLRAGIPIPTKESRPKGNYFIHISRAPERPQGRIWPISPRERLPVIPIPLKPEDADATLDLQTVLASVYRHGAYDMDTDYRDEPTPRLVGGDRTWAHQLLQSKGLR